MKQPAWSNREISILRDHYGLESPKQIAKRICSATGRKRTRVAILVASQRFSIRPDAARLSDGLLTRREAADQTGISYNVIVDACKAKLVAEVGTGKRRFLQPSAVAELQRLYPLGPRSTCSVTQFRHRLGYSETHALRLVNTGVIPAVKSGGRWRVDKAAVDHLAAEMHWHGLTRLKLPDTPAVIENRRQCAEYCRTRRKPQKAA
jgi:excisionase family DNA binding protein